VLTIFLISTLILGCVFLGIPRTIEYHDKYVEHHIPGWISISNLAPDVAIQRPPPAFLLALFRHDRLARLHMIVGPACYFGSLRIAARPLHAGLQHARRKHWPLLALRRYRLDFPVPVALSDDRH